MHTQPRHPAMRYGTRTELIPNLSVKPMCVPCPQIESVDATVGELRIASARVDAYDALELTIAVDPYLQRPDLVMFMEGARRTTPRCRPSSRPPPRDPTPPLHAPHPTALHNASQRNWVPRTTSCDPNDMELTSVPRG